MCVKVRQPVHNQSAGRQTLDILLSGLIGLLECNVQTFQKVAFMPCRSGHCSTWL